MKNRHSFRTKDATDRYPESQLLWDTPLFESDSFVTLPTVGALLEGWLLVAPRIQYLSFAHLSAKMFVEVESFLDEIVPVVESTYGPVSVFEHGPAEGSTSVGCGVDHAHLHLVPTRFDIRSTAQGIAPNVTWSKVSSLRAIRHQRISADRQPYWFLQQRYGMSDCYIGECLYGEAPSQLFRRAIATKIGCPDAFDWKTDAGEDRIAGTVRRLSHSAICA